MKYFLLLLLFLPGPVFGAVVKGLVKDSGNNPLIGANIVLIHPSGTGFGDASDIDGYYLIDFIPCGKYKVNASMIGYKVYRDSMNITDDQDTLTLNIVLNEAVIDIDTIAEIEDYHRYFSRFKPEEILQIHLDSIEVRTDKYENDTITRLFMHSTFTNLTDKPISVFANSECLTFAKPIVYNSDDKKINTDYALYDCMNWGLGLNYYLTIPPHSSISYTPFRPPELVFLPSGEYQVRLLYRFHQHKRLPGIYQEMTPGLSLMVHCFNTAFRGEFVSENLVRLIIRK